jgi:predicted ATPase/class 3 adenylate cyclase
MGSVRELSAGTVTFLFTDVEGSTRLLSELGEAYAEALARHRRVLLEAFARHDGVEVDTQGDAFFVAFARASDALAAAEEAQQVLTTGPLRVRMGLHTGEPLLTDEGYVGMDVHRAARIGGAGHGGQVVVSQTTRNLAPVDGLRDLGEHRLKDLSAPERLYQLGHQSFPPLKTLGRTNLPVPATPFLGRSRDLVAVVDLLGRRDVRVLTLVGPGGTGKTRLALQAAGAAADHYRDGVFWAPLATLRDPQLVLEAAGTALGAQRVVAEHIADKRLLLLLDNFEHVIEAAAQVGAVVAACPNLDVLVTSRELLQLRGEQAYLVPPLDVADGVELFLARARAQRPHFALDSSVPELCARLDQLPLAIELAAARTRHLSTRQLLERLTKRLDVLKAGRDVDPRQQTLRATIEWSYDLLSPDEQALFARIAIFSGGWTLDAVEEICDADLDTLGSLVDKSLVRHNEERYWLLETIREYAAERLEASRDTEHLRRRHAEYFLGWAERAGLDVDSVEAGAAPHLAAALADLDNLRAALDCLAAADPLLALAACG